MFKWLGKAVFGLVFASLAAPGVPRIQAQDSSAAFYYFNGTKTPIRFVPGEMLVMVEATSTASGGGATSPPPNASELAAAMSLPGPAVKPFGIAGWHQVTVPDSGQAGVTGARVSSVAASPGVAFATPVFLSPDGEILAPTRNILVRYRPGTNPDATLRSIKEGAIVSQSQIGQSGVWMVVTSLESGLDVLALANRLQESGKVEFASPDFIQGGRSRAIPSDPLFRDSWGLNNTGQTYQYGSSSGNVTVRGLADFDMDGDRAFDLTYGSRSVIVLILDDGVQRNHPDLHVSHARDFTTAGGDGGPVSSNDNHGTSVAGCAAGLANNGRGSTGSAPGTSIASAKIYSPDSSGRFYRMDSWVVAALDWGRSIGARVSNSSWGGGSPSSAIDNAFRVTRAAGMIHFAAAGNDNRGSISYPSSSVYVHSVGAASPDGTRVNFPGWWGSNYGTGLEFLAPGVFMPSADRTGSAGYSSGDYFNFLGTSAASPFAAGVAALLISREPGLTPDQVLARMRASCRDMGTAGYDTVTGYGLLNAHRTLVPNGTVRDDHGNTRETATSVTIPGTVRGTLVPGDGDFFRFTLTQAARLTISSQSNIDPIGSLYDSAGRQITEVDDSGGSLNFTIVSTLQPGTYFLQVRGYGNNQNGSYTVTFGATTIAAPRVSVSGRRSTTSGASAAIANGSSTVSSGNGTLLAGVSTAGNTTSSVFTITNSGNATLALTGSPSVVVTGAGFSQFRVLALPAATVSPGRSTSFSLSFAPITSGTHRATVSIATNAGTFTFVVEGAANIPADDVGNSRATAMAIRIPTRMGASLNYRGDSDVFVLTLSATTAVTMQTFGSTDTIGQLLDQNGNSLRNDDDSGDGLNFRMAVTLRAGTYYLVVRGYGNATTGGYTLSVN